MRKLLTLTAVLSLATFCQADLIRFKDNIELGGPNVEVLSRNAQKVEVKVKYGVVSLNTDRIDVIKINFADRMKKLIANGNDTAKNLFDLAVLCDQCAMPKEAAQAYALILTKKTVPEEMMKKLAETFEKMELWPEAKTAYDKLLLTNPADAGLQTKANQMGERAKNAKPLALEFGEGGQAAEAADAPKEAVVNGGPAAPPDDKGQPVVGKPKADAKPRDGMEASNLWAIEQWGNLATSEVVTQGDDNKLLSVNWTENKKEKVALRLNIDMNLTDKTKVTFDVFNNSTAPAGVCMAFNTLPNYQFFESMAFPTPLKKWETITLDVAGKGFKCAATNWKYVSDITNKDNVKDIFIMIYNREAPGSLFIDNIRFHTADEAK